MTDPLAATPDNRLSYVDQAMFLWLRASGEAPVVQIVWLYERPVNFEEVRRSFRTVSEGALGRLRIERSPLLFGRHRWVLTEPQAPEDEFPNSPRPRAEFTDWADECAGLPIDPEWGPGWIMRVQPFNDGSTGITMVISHCLADGLMGLTVVSEAIKGNRFELAYPPPRSETRRRAMAADFRGTRRDAPEVRRALGAAAKEAFRRRRDLFKSKASHPAVDDGDADRNVLVPAVVANVDYEEWESRANALGAKGHTLLAGFAAKLGERMGRRGVSGDVTLLIPTSTRAFGDNSANAATIASIPVDPTRVTTDLSDAKNKIRQGLRSARDVPDQPLELLPLIPFIPKRLVKPGGDAVFGFAEDLPVSCSNLGDLGSTLGCVDGTEADYIVLRGVDGHITLGALERRRGLLTVVAGRVGDTMSISVIAYQPGGELTKPQLRELLAGTLGEFGLTGVIE